MSAVVVTIVVPTWNQSKLTLECINSIHAMTNTPYQVVLIDNGSVDNTMAVIEGALTVNDVVVRNPMNRGFAYANNQGLALARGEYVLFLNNDTIVQGPEWVEIFVGAMATADLAGPNLCSVVPDDKEKIFIYHGVGIPGKHTWIYLEGWCLFGRKSTFEKIGGWSEEFYPTYCDDTDLGFRARAAGMRFAKVSVPIHHYVNQAFGNYDKYMNISGRAITMRNAKRLYEKWRNTDVF